MHLKDLGQNVQICEDLIQCIGQGEHKVEILKVLYYTGPIYVKCRIMS